MCVYVRDAGMHGANPPWSSNAWTVSENIVADAVAFYVNKMRIGLGWRGWGGGAQM